MIMYESKEHCSTPSRVDSFVAAVAETYFPMELNFGRTDRDSFSGRMAAKQIGSASVSELATSPLQYNRVSRHSERELDGYYLVTYLRKGIAEFQQNGRNVQVSNGQFVIEDSTQPYTFRYGANGDFTEMFALRIPRQPLLDRVRTAEDFYAGTFSTKNHPAAKLFIDFLHSIYSAGEELTEQVGGLDPDCEFMLSEQLIDLLALTINSTANCVSDAETATQNAYLRRLTRIINDNLSDPQLSVTKLSELSNLSPRYLHQIFKNTNTTISRYIRDRRLEECYRTLQNPTVKSVSLSRLAYSWGFSDQANFNRCFRAKYDMTPGDVRKQSARLGAKNQ